MTSLQSGEGEEEAEGRGGQGRPAAILVKAHRWGESRRGRLGRHLAGCR